MFRLRLVYKLGFGHWKQEELTKDKFIQLNGETIYYSGDLAKIDENGEVIFLGREDHQIKINGLRVEARDIESKVELFLKENSIQFDEVLVQTCLNNSLKYLACFIKTSQNIDIKALREELKKSLPLGVIPTKYVPLKEFPLTKNGKTCRKSLSEGLNIVQETTNRTQNHTITYLEEQLSKICAGIKFDPSQSLFEQGLTSLQAIKLVHYINNTLNNDKNEDKDKIQITDIYENPTLEKMNLFLSGNRSEEIITNDFSRSRTNKKVAIVGLSCRFPNAESFEEFREIIKSGDDCIDSFDLNEIRDPSHENIKNSRDYVPSRGVLTNIDLFDAPLFGISPRVAEVLDPQMRFLLEESLIALEDAQFVNRNTTGVFCGMSNNTYQKQVEQHHPDKIEQVGKWNFATLSEKDYVATQVGHKLNLKGPAISIHTACSTGLVAIIQGVRAIQSGDCESALCGAVHVDAGHKTGHLYQEGSIFSKDGACRPYDQDATGTIFSDGVGVVILKDYDSALRDGNKIYGLIAGCGLSNDGGDKASFSAPSVEGQSTAITKALDEAEVKEGELVFIEGHGTATPVGDPIEVTALNRSLKRLGSEKKIILSSIKAQIGHTVAASGVAGLLRAIVSLQDMKVEKLTHFNNLNGFIELKDGPLSIPSVQTDFTPIKDGRVLAGVSSFGVGGTNAHIIIEKFNPSAEVELKPVGPYTLSLSAETNERLFGQLRNLETYLMSNELSASELLALEKYYSEKNKGKFRVAIVGLTQKDLTLECQSIIAKGSVKKVSFTGENPYIVFAFSGQGSQYSQQGKTLYNGNKVFRAAFDECCELYSNEFSVNLSDIILESNNGLINFTTYTQPAIFAFQYSLYCVLKDFGLAPESVIGHSVGEIAAAVVAGIMKLPQAIRLIGHRARLMGEIKGNWKMLAVRSNSQSIHKLLTDLNLRERIHVAVVNGAESHVVGGEESVLRFFAEKCKDLGIKCTLINTSHAFHTPQMKPMLSEFKALMEKEFSGKSLKYPRIPILKTSMQDNEPHELSYWVDHIESPVNFYGRLLNEKNIFKGEREVIVIDLGPKFQIGQLIKTFSLSSEGNPKIRVYSPNKGNVPLELKDLIKFKSQISIDFPNIIPSKLIERDDIEFNIRALKTIPKPFFMRKSFWAGHKEIINKKTNIVRTEMSVFKNELTKFISDVSGFDDLDTQSSFLELGLDSLLLTQLATEIKNKYQVEIGFRELMDQYDSIDILCSLLLERNPGLNTKESLPSQSLTKIVAEQETKVVSKTSVSQQPRQVASVPLQSFSSQKNYSSDMGKIISDQMELMKLHLSLLSGQPIQTTENLVPEEDVTEVPVAKEEERPSSPDSTSLIEEENIKATVNTAKQAFGAQARVNTEKSQELIDQGLEKVIKAYIKKTPKSKAYTQKYRKVNADPRVVTGFRPELKEITYPLVVNYSKNQRLFDIDGNEYVDVTCGFGSNFFGNQNERITKALHDQLDKGMEIGPQHELAGICAELFCEISGNERAAFCNTGSEAVLGALRIARTITGRKKVVMFKGSYHGINDEVIVRGRGDGKALPAAAGINASSTSDMVLLDYGTKEALDYVRTNANDLAAVIVEPVQSRRTDFRPKEFLKELRVITEKSGSAFIFDEVITGFRIAPGGAQEYFGIKADLATYGKIIGGGMPIGIVSGKAKFMDALDGGDWSFEDNSMPTVAITYFAGTFVRHPLALRALKEALEIIKEGGQELYYDINKKAQNFVDKLNLLSEVNGAPIIVDNFGGVLKPRFTDTGKNNDVFFALMRLNGVHCYDGFPWFVTLGHQNGDLAFVESIWEKSIKQMKSLKLFPSNILESDLKDIENSIEVKSGELMINTQIEELYKDEKSKLN